MTTVPEDLSPYLPTFPGMARRRVKTLQQERAAALQAGAAGGGLMPDRRDILLCHCVELTCPHCGHMVRVARCQCDLDAMHLVDLYKREILLYDLECHHCDRPYCNPGAARRVNRSRDDWLEGVKLEEEAR